MGSAEKKIDAMRANPKADWQINDFETVAKALDMQVRKSGGSHVVFSHATSRTRLTVPARRPIKPVYVKAFVEFIDEIRELS
jgi:predicted RNA binding protein YcfA (HicA-like mRNA interferase family)